MQEEDRSFFSSGGHLMERRDIVTIRNTIAIYAIGLLKFEEDGLNRMYLSKYKYGSR